MLKKKKNNNNNMNCTTSFPNWTETSQWKPRQIEKTLQCTLEELCHGCVKKIKINRDIVTGIGTICREEVLKIKVKPGWKKGTRITFEGRGNEVPGCVAGDIVFCIDERRHALFKREGDDLELGVEITLAMALTGCTIPVPLLGGETMYLCLDDVIHPGFEKLIPGQGMPTSKSDRGNLRLKFLVNFPTDLSREQRSVVCDILREDF